MNKQRAISASKITTQHMAQSLSAMLDHRVDFYTLGAYWMRRTLCVVIFGRTHCMQTIHLIIFCPIEWSNTSGHDCSFHLKKKETKQNKNKTKKTWHEQGLLRAILLTFCNEQL